MQAAPPPATFTTQKVPAPIRLSVRALALRHGLKTMHSVEASKETPNCLRIASQTATNRERDMSLAGLVLLEH
jgi:hypothetical protein